MEEVKDDYLQYFEKQRRLIQKRLVKYDQELRLRKELKRKIKPAVQEPAEVPMAVYYNIV